MGYAVALKIDSCEVMVREIRRKVTDLSNDTRSFIRFPPVTSSEDGQPVTTLPERPCVDLHHDILNRPEAWNSLDFEAPLEISRPYTEREIVTCAEKTQDSGKGQSTRAP